MMGLIINYTHYIGGNMNDMLTDVVNTIVDNYYKDQKVIDTNENSDQTYETNEDYCMCGKKIDECPDAYDHITHGV